MTLTEEQKAFFDALTQLQRRFVTALLEGANQTETYRRAGGKAKGDGVRSKASQLVTNSNVQAFLQSVQHETVNEEAIMTYTEALCIIYALSSSNVVETRRVMGLHRALIGYSGRTVNNGIHLQVTLFFLLHFSGISGYSLKTITGRITKNPKRIKTQAGKVMAMVTIQVETDKRTPYPLCVVGFDLLALELMLCPLRQTITVNGRSAYWSGYQITASHIQYNQLV